MKRKSRDPKKSLRVCYPVFQYAFPLIKEKLLPLALAKV
jgi:hypothetical protein